VLDSVSANFPVSPKKFWWIGTVGMVLQRFDSIKKLWDGTAKKKNLYMPQVSANSKEEKPVRWMYWYPKLLIEPNMTIIGVVVKNFSHIKWPLRLNWSGKEERKGVHRVREQHPYLPNSRTRRPSKIDWFLTSHVANENVPSHNRLALSSWHENSLTLSFCMSIFEWWTNWALAASLRTVIMQ